MNKESMFKAVLLGFIVFLGMACSSSGNKTTKNVKGMDTTFCWEPLVASPRFYPMEVKYASVGLGNTEEWVGAMERFTGAGLGEASGTVDMSSVPEDGKLEVPGRIDVLWLSYTEKKFYRLKAEIPHYLQHKMLTMFRTGYKLRHPDEDVTYDGFVINMLPKGHVWLYLTGTGRSELLCDSLVGEEVEMSLKDFDEEGYEYHKTLDAFCRGRLSDYPDAVENLKQNGIPEGLWDIYKRRFHYDIDYSFEDKNTVLGDGYLYRFLTGEYFHRDDNVKHPTLPCVREIQMIWRVGTTEYNGYFYFDEDEIIRTYAKAFDRWSKDGKLIIRVSKYNNLFDIYLLVDGKQYSLTKTKIHVFYYTPENKNKDDHLFYWNYENEEIKKYIGE